MISIADRINKTIQANALKGLKNLPTDSVDCIVTSPPYWGLRSYGEETIDVWDGDESCEHEWLEKRHVDTRGIEGTGLNGRDPNKLENRLHYTEGFCRHCNAWRGQLGLEPTFQLFIQHLLQIFDECYRVLKPTGTCWVNLGDSYAGSNQGYGTVSMTEKQKSNRGTVALTQKKSNIAKVDGVKPKSLCQIPSRFAIAMTDNGWILRNEIIWWKRNAMPSSAKDRFTVDFEKLFFFTKSGKYFFEQQLEKSIWADFDKRSTNGSSKGKGETEQEKYSMQGCGSYTEGGQRNMRTVWDIPTRPLTDAHFAAYPEQLVEICIKAGCPENGIVLDPFGGSGTTGIVARKLNRNYIMFEMVSEYIKIKEKRKHNHLGFFQ